MSVATVGEVDPVGEIRRVPIAQSPLVVCAIGLEEAIPPIDVQAQLSG